jgi:glycosyltransferase involved in cell wall biosynthesis
MKTRSELPRVAVIAAGPDIIGGHSVQAAAITTGLRQEGIDAFPLAINRAFPRGLRWARRWPGVRTVTNEALYASALGVLASVDVAHVFSASYWSFLLAPVPAMLAARRYGARVVLHYHSGEVADHLDNWGWRVHPWLDLADDIVVCSEFQRQAFARHGRRARVIPNVVDVTRFAFRPRAALAPRLLSNRTLEPTYRVDVVLEAFRRIREQRPDATLTIAGTGSEEPRLRAAALAIDAERITFAGAVPSDQMPALLDAHDVFLNASVVDNQPVSLIEALAAGLAVVSTPTGGIAEMVEDGVTGRLVAADAPEAMAHAVLDLLEHPDAAHWMTRRARATTDRYQWTSVWPLWRQVYGLGDTRPASGEAARISGTIHAVGERF